MSKKLTNKEFIIKANKVHNNKYDYSKVNYINNHSKVVISCLIHGNFEQKPNHHLSGQGCRMCAGNNFKSTKEEFILKSNKIHNNKYDYSKVIYTGNKDKVKIICIEHGIFEQKPNHHLSGQGCKICSGKDRTHEQLILEFKKIHNDKYDYSLIDYSSPTKKIKIICKEHGLFYQLAISHIRGYGCCKCSGKNKLTTQEFIKKAEKIHGEKYDYSLVDFKNNKTKVKIICQEHGIFEQRPNCHLNGKSCKLCVESKGEKKIRVLLNNLNIKFESQKKFSNCINPKTNRKLSFDFYLPDYNTCIEYDGRQHFEYYHRFKNNLDEYLFRDNVKNNYTKQNNITLLRIPYTKFNDIDSIIRNNLIK